MCFVFCSLLNISESDDFVLFPAALVRNTPELTLPETNSKSSENGPGPKKKFIFQPSIFRGEILVLGRVYIPAHFFHLTRIHFVCFYEGGRFLSGTYR